MTLPDGQIKKFVSIPLSKNIPLREKVEAAIDQKGLIPKRGAARDRHERGGWGCGGRGWHQVREGVLDE